MSSTSRAIPLLACFIVALAAAPAGAVSGGTALPIETAPYVVAVNGNCTGTLITPTRVLTAGHCLDGSSAGDAQILVGVDGHLVTDGQRKADAVGVLGYAVDPSFKESFPFSHKSLISAIAINDVGLILLRRPVATVTPVSIARAGDALPEAPGTSPSLIGYGDTGPPAPFKRGSGPAGPVALQQGSLSLLGESACAHDYPNALLPSMLCTEDLTHQTAPYVQACSGDSGGPIIETTAGGPVQIGITSWGPEVKDGVCGVTHLPNVAMRVSSFTAFITSPKPVIEPFTLHAAPGDLRRFPVGATIAGTTQVGHTVTCNAPKLGGDPATLSYTWALVQDLTHVVAHGRRLQITDALYASATSPRRLFCTAIAKNAGGTLKLMAGSKRLLK